MQTSIPKPAEPLNDASLWAIVGGNALTMFLAVGQQWPVSEIMWIYWWQSVFIGAANFRRMWTLKEFSTAGMKMNDRPVPETQAGARSTAIFFAMHYGFFHFVYMIFLFAMSAESEASPSSLVDNILAFFAVTAFLASHFFSLRYNASRDFKSKKPNLGSLMFYPYLRIIPMHLTIIFGGMLETLSLVIFMGLKTVADAGMHIIEHHIFRAPEKARAGA